MELRTRTLSYIRQPFVLQEAKVPFVGAPVHLALHLGRMLLLSDTVAEIRRGGDIRPTGGDSLYICPDSCQLIPLYRWQASRLITLPQPVNSLVVLGFVCADKRDLRELWEASMVQPPLWEMSWNQ